MWPSKLATPQVFCARRYVMKRVGNQVRCTATSAPSTAQIPIDEKVVKKEPIADPKVRDLKVNSYLSKASYDQELSHLGTMSFDEIPGPITLRLISRFWNTLPIMANDLTLNVVQYLMSGGRFFGSILSWGGNIQFFQKFFRVYGPVVRLHGAFGSDVVLLSRPEHASIIFATEGQYPIRSCLDSVEKYRLECRRFRQAGPFLMYGPDWERLRKSIEVPLNATLDGQHTRTIEVCNEFIKRIYTIRNKQDEMPNFFRVELLKWSLESICSVILDKKMGFLDPCGVSPTSDPGRILDGLIGATEAISKCEYGFQMWKFFSTPSFKSLVKNCDMIDAVLNKHLDRAAYALKEKKESELAPNQISLLESLLLKENIDKEDVMTILLDMFLIGANATSHTAAFLIYYLARNPRCQMKLHEEMKSYGDTPSRADLKNMAYLQACVKEVLRLDPPIPILSRILNTDVTVHQYRIPKGTNILFANHLNGVSEEYFEDAQKFKPERWLSNELGGFGNEYQKFASMPFGYGARSCLAREMAEMEITLLLFKICKKFRIQYNYGDILSSNELIATPLKPLKFRFVDRT